MHYHNKSFSHLFGPVRVDTEGLHEAEDLLVDHELLAAPPLVPAAANITVQWAIAATAAFLLLQMEVAQLCRQN